MEGKFQNVWHELRANLLVVSGQLKLRVNELLEPYDLTQQQFNALRILRGAQPIALTVGQIRERLLDPSSDAPRLVDRLEQKGWISRVRCTADGRRTLVCLTPSGEELLKNLDQQMHQLDALIQLLTEDEAKKLNGLLDKLYAGLAKEDTAKADLAKQN